MERVKKRSELRGALAAIRDFIGVWIGYCEEKGAAHHSELLQDDWEHYVEQPLPHGRQGAAQLHVLPSPMQSQSWPSPRPVTRPLGPSLVTSPGRCLSTIPTFVLISSGRHWMGISIGGSNSEGTRIGYDTSDDTTQPPGERGREVTYGKGLN